MLIGSDVVCVTVSSVQHFEAVLPQSELCQSGRRPDGGLLCVMFPHHSTQQRSVESLSQLGIADNVPLRTCQRSAPHHNPGRLHYWHINA